MWGNPSHRDGCNLCVLAISTEHDKWNVYKIRYKNRYLNKENYAVLFYVLVTELKINTSRGK